MSLLSCLQEINPQIDNIKVQPILNKLGVTVGHNAYVITRNNETIAGGTSENEYVALRIAIAEAFERSYVESMYHTPLEREFFLDVFPSTSGFAAGFDATSTKMRALCEGLERWIWSKWIDEGYEIEEIESTDDYNKLSEALIEKYEYSLWYEKKFSFLYNHSALELKIGIFIGVKDNGVFPGSRVCTINENSWNHAIIESHRNYVNSIKSNDINDIIDKRAKFFAQNKIIAFEQINNSKNKNWPEPELLLLKDLPTAIPQIFLSRCLFKNFVGWDKGDEKRFVY